MLMQEYCLLLPHVAAPHLGAPPGGQAGRASTCSSCITSCCPSRPTQCCIDTSRSQPGTAQALHRIRTVADALRRVDGQPPQVRQRTSRRRQLVVRQLPRALQRQLLQACIAARSSRAAAAAARSSTAAQQLQLQPQRRGLRRQLGGGPALAGARSMDRCRLVRRVSRPAAASAPHPAACCSM